MKGLQLLQQYLPPAGHSSLIPAPKETHLQDTDPMETSREGQVQTSDSEAQAEGEAQQGGAGEPHDEQVTPRVQEEIGEELESWQVVGGSARFKCNICGKTRNTKSKMEKHMNDHEEDNDDVSATCTKCSYQTTRRDDLIKHISKAHGINQILEKCNQCDNKFKTEKDLTNHIKENRKTHKPCDYFKEDRCDLDAECRFKHIKLKSGEQICYTCGKTFSSRKDMLSHIKEKHGHIPCHRFLKNECTVRRCLFSHNTLPVTNVEISSPAPRARAPPAQDFQNLHATRPVMWSQVVAETPHLNPPVQRRITNQEILSRVENMEESLMILRSLISQ